MTAAAQISDRLVRVWEPEFTGHIWEWADGLDLPQSTRAATFRPEESPWLLPIFEALADPRIREVVVMAPAGSAKSLLAEIFIAWIVKNAPGLTYYVCQTDSDAQDAMEDRIMPMLLANHVTAQMVPLDRSKKRVTKVMFPGMPFYALGANLNNAQSKRVKYLLCDETHTWESGILAAMRKRTNAVAGAKTLIVSTGSETGDETDEAFQAGTMEEFQVQCPACHRFQAMRNRAMDYDTTAETMDGDGNYRMAALRRTVGYLCEFADCAASGKDYKWKGDPLTRRQILEGSHYRATNPNAADDRRSFHYPGHVVPWLAWEDLAEEWIKANRAAAVGVLEPRKDYIQKQLGESWDASPREEDQIKTGHRVGAYQRRDPWDEELTRFCAADQQARKFYAVCVLYSADGSSRAVDAAVLDTFEDYETFRRDNRTEPARTGLDIAFNTSISQQRCAQYGWTGLWGDERAHWPHDVRSPWHPRNVALRVGVARRTVEATIPDRPVMLPFSPRQRAQAGLGLSGKIQTAFYHYWSNPKVKDIWHHLHNGLGASMTAAHDLGKLFFAQSAVETKVRVYDKGTGQKSKWAWVVPSKKSADEMKQDHYLDARQMNLSLALMDERISLSRAVLGGEGIVVPEMAG